MAWLWYGYSMVMVWLWYGYGMVGMLWSGYGIVLWHSCGAKFHPIFKGGVGYFYIYKITSLFLKITDINHAHTYQIYIHEMGQ